MTMADYSGPLHEEQRLVDPAPAERPIDRLVPGSDLHQKVLEYLKHRIKFSEEKMSNFHSRWRVAEQKTMAYVDLPNYEKVLKEATDKGQPPDIVSVVVPYSFATVWTICTYLLHTFCGRKPIFQVTSYQKESFGKASNVETMLQMNADYNKLVDKLMQFFFDGELYGVAVLRTLWQTKRRRRSRPMMSSPAGLAAPGLAQRNMQQRTEEVVYEGNEIINIDPFMFFPDPRVPMKKVNTEGEFVFWRTFSGLSALKKEERNGTLKWVKHAGSMPRDGHQVGAYGGSSNRSLLSKGDPHPGMEPSYEQSIPSFVQIDQGTIEIPAAELGLGDEDYPEKWLFTILNLNQIVQAEPLDLDHDRHPVSVAEPGSFGYGFGQVGTADMIGPIQDSLSWFLNSHVYNVRAALNNMFLVDPSRIEMQDLKNPGPGKLIRIKRSAYGQDIRQFFQQLNVHDVTGQHVQSMEAFFRLGDTLAAINDNLRGIQEAGGRKTATEVRTSNEAGASRLAARARLISAHAITDLAEQMTLNLQQLQTMEFYLQVVGPATAMSEPISIGAPQIEGNFQFPVNDGTLPIDRVALLDVWKELFGIIVSNPLLIQRYDIGKVFEHIAELGGARNVSEFSLAVPNQMQAQVMPDEQVQREAERGNLSPVGQR